MIYTYNLPGCNNQLMLCEKCCITVGTLSLLILCIAYGMLQSQITLGTFSEVDICQLCFH